MIGKAIADHYSLTGANQSQPNENLLFIRWVKKPHADVPKITVVHEDRPMLKAPDELERSKKNFRDKKVIFLVRDPRDVIISSYFEMSKRGHLFGDNPYENRQAVFNGNLQEFINRRQGGFDTIIAYYNIWAENCHIPKDFLLLRYEDIRANPQKELRKTLNFLGLNIISDATVAKSIAYASFDNMRMMEANGKFQSGMLKPADKKDKDTYKTRKGEIKGFVKYLSNSEVEMLNLKMQSDLSPIYGYTSG
jgi:hypothetical protein